MPEVVVSREPLSLPTYGLGLPEKNPLFFEKRVYQGSCGKVYPVPFIDKVFDRPEPKSYDSVRLENDFVRLVMLPEIGGRIFTGQDKTNSDYDFFYRQDVIKPALVGLAGPWISGGVEFNWPQHHRPGTYMPADVHVEYEPDGARTVWLSEHDPLNRLKGMHGIRLRPDSALIELRGRLFNRTPLTQTFLWWANVAAMVHENYQSFFPPDVHYVADHAVRAQSSFPIAQNDYYGIDYASRDGANDLSWYKNIPVPTSYMVCDSDYGFFGGYDYHANGGFVHVANPHVSPGKKQWTWGNHDFGWAWDRELTDNNGPYVELMAGVFTDNQPDFSYLLPYETKTFSQFWWPFKDVGPVQNATEDAAVRLVVNDDRSLDLGAVASRQLADSRVVVRQGNRILVDQRLDLTPNNPWQNRSLKFSGDNIHDLEIVLHDSQGKILVAYRPVDTSKLTRNRGVATEPPLPEAIETSEELYLTGEHLEQLRHPTCYPEQYWQEALRRDPQDVRSNIAIGRQQLGSGCFELAANHFATATQRLTFRHPNPYTGEANYFLGVARRFQGRFRAAYASFYKAIWNHEWKAAAWYELAAIDCCEGNLQKAIEHCDAALDANRNNGKAVVLKAIVLRKLGQDSAALLSSWLAIDPLDHWARYESGDVDGFLTQTRNDAQTVLDIAYDYADVGCFDEAIKLLQLHHASESATDAVPNPLSRSQLTHYALAWLQDQLSNGSAKVTLESARALCPDYFFPSRLHDQVVLEWAMQQAGADGNAAFGLGNYLYDRKRHEDAIECWEEAGRVMPKLATVFRNLGIAQWNVRGNGPLARAAFEQARKNDPEDARIFFEYDQLRKKLGDTAEDRLAALLAAPHLVADRDDCTVELAALYNQTNQSEKTLQLISGRRFHPWEGGEGQVLRQYTLARLSLGQQSLESKDAQTALDHFQQAMQAPENLGEAYHLLQAKADVNYWIGKALRALGRDQDAVVAFEASAAEAGDFQAGAVTEHSELSYFRGLSLFELGREQESLDLFTDMKAFSQRKKDAGATIDYFATSLPLLLVFEDDLNKTNLQEAELLIELAQQGLDLFANATHLNY